MSLRKSSFPMAAALISLFAVTASADDDERSKVLSLVSLEYKLDGIDHARSHDLLPYLPLLTSGDFGVTEVAALSVLWEQYTIVPHRAFKSRINAVEGLFGGMKIRPPGVKDDEQDLEAAMKEARERLSGPLQEAIKRGAIAAYEGKDILAESQRGFDQGLKDGVANIIAKQADYYAAQLTLAKMQDVLWDRAMALAGRGSRPGDVDAKEVPVELRLERGRGFVISVRNLSSKDLQHVTLGAIVTKMPIQTPSAGTDLVLGALTSAMSGEDDPGATAKNAATFAASTQAYWALQKRPHRIFVHVPQLPAGKEWSTMLLRSTSELAHAESASFSLWSDELAVERGEIGGFNSLVTAARKQAEEARQQMIARRRAGMSPLGAARAGAGRPFAGSTATRRPGPATGKTGQGVMPRAGAAAKGSFARKNAEAPAEDTNSSRPEGLLKQARSSAKANPIGAAVTFRRIVSQFPKSGAAAEAADWLKEYPKRLMERAEELDRIERTRPQAVRFWRAALTAEPGSPEAAEARNKLDTLARQLWTNGEGLESAGEKVRARSIYQRLIRDVPESPEAKKARERLPKLGPAR
jgi:TolA-binding protein